MKKALSVLIMIIAGLIYVGISYAGPKEELELQIKVVSMQIEQLKRFQVVNDAIKLGQELNVLSARYQAILKADEAKAPKKKENKPDKR